MLSEEVRLKDVGRGKDSHDLPVLEYRQTAKSLRKHQLDSIPHAHLRRHYRRVGRHNGIYLDRIQLPAPAKYIAIRDDADKSLAFDDREPSKVAALHQ